MDFSYPGKASHGDLPPRPDVAPRWHPRLPAELPHVRLTVLIGRHTQKHHLPESAGANSPIRPFRDHLPDGMALVHPSPLNFRWQDRNPRFADEAIPTLRARVHAVRSRTSIRPTEKPEV